MNLTPTNPQHPATSDEKLPEAHPGTVIMAAYQCAPGQGSVSQIGWEWYHRLARRRPVLLVTHIRNRETIEASAQRPANADIVYIDTEWFAGPLFRMARRLLPRSEHGVFLISSLDFFLFDWLALRALRRRLRAGVRASVVHVVTPVTRAAPSALHRLGLPLVRGPLNCGLENPKGFDQQLRDDSRWLMRLRELPRVLDGLIGGSRKASVILAATQATRQDVPQRYRAKTRMMLENGIALEHFPAAPWPAPPGATEPLRVLFVGRLVAFKGVDMLLWAMSRLKQQGIPATLTLVGDGPLRRDWESLAHSLNIGDLVHFAGALPLEAVHRAMHDCHVFCLPSVRESGGAVVIEAMASARPVIALQHGGPAELGDESVGRLISPHSPEQVIRDLAQALTDVVKKPSAWAQRGERGRRRVERRYTWEGKIAEAERIYAELTSNLGTRRAEPFHRMRDHHTEESN